MKIRLVILAFCVLLLLYVFIVLDSKYARNLEFYGEVREIIWESKNHKLPQIIIVSENGNAFVLSHTSIGLTEFDIKEGDNIYKIKGSDYCYINNEKVLFVSDYIKDLPDW